MQLMLADRRKMRNFSGQLGLRVRLASLTLNQVDDSKSLFSQGPQEQAGFGFTCLHWFISRQCKCKGIVGTGWGRVDGIADSQVGRIEAPPLLKFYMSLRLMGGRRLMRTAPGFNLEF